MLAIELPWLENIEPAKAGRRLPVVLTRHEVQLLLNAMRGTPGLMARLLYGTGMRLMEGVRLRIKDIDFERCELVVREGKGHKDRITMLPTTLKIPLQEHLKRVLALHAEDLAAGYGEVYLPFALARKYPHARRELAWQYVFPAAR